MGKDRTARRAIRFDRILIAIALLAYALGAAARVDYALFAHPPRHQVVSDVFAMLQGVSRMLGETQGRWDTVWPPGQTAFLALTSRFDATLKLGAFVQLALSLCVPWLAASVAGQLSNRRGYWFGLAAASLHIGYVHHVGFFLSESLCQLATACAIWGTTTAIRASAEPLARRWRGWWLGLGAGTLWGLAALFRPNAMPMLLTVCLASVVLGLVTRAKALRWLALATLCGGLLSLAPAMHRCTVLQGRFCPVSANFAMNVALGQAGDKAGLAFAARGRPGASVWTPPALLGRGYRGYDTVPATIFDAADILRWVAERVREDPAGALANAARNATDIFRPNVWPGIYASWPDSLFVAAAWAFMGVVLVPGLLGSLRVLAGLRSRIRLRREAAAFVAVAGVLGVALLAGITLGEARYRYPFDLWWIALAARGLMGAPKSATPVRRTERLALLCATAGAATIALLSLVAHPFTSLAARLAPDPFVSAGTRIEQQGAELAAQRPAGTPWNEGTTILPCAWTCTELRVAWPEPQHGSQLRMAADHNDAYRVVLTRGAQAVATVDLPPHVGRAGRPGPGGLQEHWLPIPDEAQGFDGARIVPLYGDGAYSIGHVIVTSADRPARKRNRMRRFLRRTTD